MHQPVLVADPAVQPITLPEAKAFCRVDWDDEDGLFGSLIADAVEHFDGYAGTLGRCLINQTWRQDFHCWPARGVLRLPFPDVSSVTLKYFDTDNAEQTVSSSLYETLEDARSAYVHLLDDFTAPNLYDDRDDAVQVTFVAGYGAAASDVPADLKTVLKYYVLGLYERSDLAETFMNLAERKAAKYSRVGV